MLMDYPMAMKSLGFKNEIERLNSGLIVDESGKRAPFILGDSRVEHATEVCQLVFP